MATTFRTDVCDGILAVLTTYAAAHPDQLVRAYRARPASMPDLPAAYIENRPESISHSQGVRTRIMTPSVVVVRRITDNAETMAAFDTLVDGLVDAFTAVPQFASDTIWSELTVADEDAPFGDYDFAAVRFTFGNVSIDEGRT
jgi:hypothetical protein